MKFNNALRIIHDYEEDQQKQPTGYMVSFEVRERSILHSDHFPDKHAGEQLIETENEAWELAMRFQKAAGDDYVNIYVIDQTFSSVNNYSEKIINKYPPRKLTNVTNPSEFKLVLTENIAQEHLWSLEMGRGEGEEYQSTNKTIRLLKEFLGITE